ncbi:DUF2779 domain-containing protein [Bradyrhizobium arachidis]|uniref:DUF2779 domain-containing protein n=1 Tax=Bradyrhizobium arachidis TaxID=858423 RepID=UPI0021620440|nr:DUF2779 domain-containing protein [Bradyrhizobium arachidis]UVO37630.1 DUF2779 domain-containing protein [Bradyrhizobium arachidis]
MQNLSKSKLLAFRQCPKRLWLEVNRPNVREDTSVTEAGFQMGREVGEIARQLYDPEGVGELVDAKLGGLGPALARSAALLDSSAPIFEAGFAAEGALAFVDIMLPLGKEPKRSWRIVGVKSSTSVKDYHRDDIAIQAFVARAAGVPLDSVALAHINSDWLYPGNEQYRGLLIENDLTDEAFERSDEVRHWIAVAQNLIQERSEPKVGLGTHCHDPSKCSFLAYCRSQEPQAEFPIEWLPRWQNKSSRDLNGTEPIKDLRDAPDRLLSEIQKRVKAHTLSGEPFFDQIGAAAELAQFGMPASFLDFETIQFAVPFWENTRPYQQIPFQFSHHGLSQTGTLDHLEFLNLSGDDPSKLFAEALITACGHVGPVFVYNAGFEVARIKELGERFPSLNDPLTAISERIVDLLPIARRYYYHPSQEGSWSIKSLLPAIASDISYDKLDGVKDGSMAATAYIEAIHPKTSFKRRDQIRRQLLDYCSLDTYALVRLWQHFVGQIHHRA